MAPTTLGFGEPGLSEPRSSCRSVALRCGCKGLLRLLGGCGRERAGADSPGALPGAPGQDFLRRSARPRITKATQRRSACFPTPAAACGPWAQAFSARLRGPASPWQPRVRGYGPARSPGEMAGRGRGKGHKGRQTYYFLGVRGICGSPRAVGALRGRGARLSGGPTWERAWAPRPAGSRGQ